MRTNEKGKLDTGPIRGPEALKYGLQDMSSNLYGILVKDPSELRFLRVSQRGESDWLAVLGSYDGEGLPIVAFGNGHDYCSAMYSLGSSLAAGQWRGDKFAK